MPKINLTNKKYPYFTVLERNVSRTGKNVWWNCLCHCGKIFTATTTDINKEKVHSCGCMRKQLIGQAHLQDLVGEVFGELEVIERDFNHEQHGSKPRTYWKCRCSCGNIVSVERAHLVCRGQSSCGCKNSIGELHINKILSNNSIQYKSQYTNSDLETEKGGYLKFDFAIMENNKVIRLIEFDGPQHDSNNANYFSNDTNLAERDNVKNNYAKKNNIPLVRISYYKRDSMTIEDLMGDQFII